MRLPQLLIIGAMKSGTTGVFMDLCLHPQVFEQSNKEPHFLCSDKVLTAAGQAEYESVYEGAREDQLLCDASTGYTKRPDREGMAERAVKVLPDDFRAVYVVRDPIERIISQHHHEHVEGKVPASIDEAVRQFPRYVEYSRYGYQLTPWIEAIGPDRVRVIRFEDYKADRQKVTKQLCEWLGLDTALLPPPDSTVHNRAAGRPQITSFWQSVQRSSAYRRLIRPLVATRTRVLLQRLVLPKALDRPAPPSSATISWLRGQLADDVRQISRYAGSPTPLWGDYIEGTLASASGSIGYP